MCGGGHPPVCHVSHRIPGLGERPDPGLPRQAAGIQHRNGWVSPFKLLLIFLSQKTQAASSCLAVFRWTWRTRRCEASRTQSSQDCWSAGFLVRLSVLPMSAPLSACQAPRFYLPESLDAVCVLGWNRKAQRWFIFWSKPVDYLLIKGSVLFSITPEKSSVWGLDLLASHRCVVPSGVKVITAPVSISARFKHPPSLPRRVTIQFGESTNNVRFHMHHHGGSTPHVTGLISRSWSSSAILELIYADILRTFPTLHPERSSLSHGSTSFGVIYYFAQPDNKKYEPVSQDDFTTLNVSLRSSRTKCISCYIKQMVWHMRAIKAVKEYKANQSFMVILGLSTWFCTAGLMDVNDQLLQTGLMETSPLHRWNTSIFDLTLQFETSMYVKLRLLLFIEAHLVYGSERSGFHACLHHCNISWRTGRRRGCGFLHIVW